MPKQKTKKAVKKRVKVTAKGKILHHRAGKRHLLSGKSAKRRRRLRRKKQLAGVEMKKVKRMLGPGYRK